MRTPCSRCLDLGLVHCDRSDAGTSKDASSCTACRSYHKSCRVNTGMPHTRARMRNLLALAIHHLEALIHDIEDRTGIKQDQARTKAHRLCQFRDLNDLRLDKDVEHVYSVLERAEGENSITSHSDPREETGQGHRDSSEDTATAHERAVRTASVLDRRQEWRLTSDRIACWLEELQQYLL